MRAYCGIPGESFFVVAFDRDGAISAVISPEQQRNDGYESFFFDGEKFQETMRPSEHSTFNVPGESIH